MGRDQEAVQSYLDDLLSEPPAVSLQKQAHPLEAIKRQQLQALLDRPLPVEVAPPQSIKPTIKPTMAPPDAPLAGKTESLVAEPESLVAGPKSIAAELEPVSPLLQWGENGRPLWAQQKFDALLFRVSGLTLAVPLIALGQIHPLTDDLTLIFGQADWFMGLQPTSMGRIRTVNTALLVMPERYDPAFLQSARYVVTIDGTDWGLAVDQVQQPTRLNPDDVTWRSQRGKRPWLAGTVKTAMCALLDVPQMGRLLQSHERPRPGVASR